MSNTPWRKSSRSGGNGAGSSCVEARASWRKSSRSGPNGGGSDCVEARVRLGVLQIRDSKLGDASPILDLTNTEFTSFLATVKR